MNIFEWLNPARIAEPKKTVFLEDSDGELSISSVHATDAGLVASRYGKPVLLDGDGAIKAGPCFVKKWHKRSGFYAAGEYVPT